MCWVFLWLALMLVDRFLQGTALPYVWRLFWQKVPTEIPTKKKVTPTTSTCASTVHLPLTMPSFKSKQGEQIKTGEQMGEQIEVFDYSS